MRRAAGRGRSEPAAELCADSPDSRADLSRAPSRPSAVGPAHGGADDPAPGVPRAPGRWHPSTSVRHGRDLECVDTIGRPQARAAPRLTLPMHRTIHRAPTPPGSQIGPQTDSPQRDTRPTAIAGHPSVTPQAQRTEDDDPDGHRIRPPPPQATAELSRQRARKPKALRPRASASTSVRLRRPLRHPARPPHGPSSDAHHRNLMRRPHRAGPFGHRHGTSRHRSACSSGPSRPARCSAPRMFRDLRDGREARSVRPTPQPHAPDPGSGTGRVSGRTGGGGRAWLRRRRGD